MTRAKPKRAPAKQTTAPQLPDAGESRGAVAVTVAWMLLALSCAAAQVVALATWLLARAAAPAAGVNHLLPVPRTMLIVALLTGVLILLLTPLVYRVRKSRPPRAITVVAVGIAVGPLVTVIVATALS